MTSPTLHWENEKPPLLQRYFLQTPIELIKLVDLSDEEVSVSGGNLGVRNMDHVLVNVEINLGARFEFSLQPGGSLGPDNVLHLKVNDIKVSPELSQLLGSPCA